MLRADYNEILTLNPLISLHIPFSQHYNYNLAKNG